MELRTPGDNTKYDNDYVNFGGVAVLDDEKFGTVAFEVGDIVTFNYSLQGTKGSVKNVKAAEAVTGNVESFTTNKKFSLDGTTYEYGAKVVNVYGSSDIGTQSTVYMDENGYVLYAKEGEDNLKNYALVLNAGPKSALSGTDYQAWLLYTDGTTAVVDTDKDYSDGKGNGSNQVDFDEAGNTGKNLVGKWVTYKTNSDGEVVLTQPKPANASQTEEMDANSISTSTTNGRTGITLDTGVTASVNSATVVIVRNADDEFDVYTGVKEMPTISGANNANAYSVYSTGTFAKLVYVELNGNAVVDTGSSKTIFLVGDADAEPSSTLSDTFYTFDAVVDGVLVEDGVSLDYTDTNTKAVVDNYLKDGKSIALNSYSEKNGLYTVSLGAGNVNIAKTAVSDVEKVSGNCIAFDDAAFYTADDCVFYRVDKDGNLRSSSINGVRTDDVGVGEYYLQVFYTVNNDAELTGVYWVYNR